MKKIKFLTLTIVCTLLLGILVACGGNDTPASSNAKANAKVTLILEDGSQVPYDITVTEGVSLRDALYEAKLIDEETYGAMTVDNIDGHVADMMNDGVIWKPVDKDGNDLKTEIKVESMCMLDSIAVNDGDDIYLKYFTVPYAD